MVLSVISVLLFVLCTSEKLDAKYLLVEVEDPLPNESIGTNGNIFSRELIGEGVYITFQV